MAKKGNAPEQNTTESRPARRGSKILDEFVQTTGSDVYKLMYICVVPLETCIGASGKIDPAASWPLAHVCAR
jgi:hypothetical protein